MHPGIAEYRTEYAEPVSKKQGYLHLAWGLKLYSDKPDKDIRTLFNALSQGYSCLTMIALNKFDTYLEDNNLRNRISITNTIHDAVYLEIDDNIETIKLVNDVLPSIMSEQFVVNQEIPLAAECDIGYNLYDTITLKHGTTEEEIQDILDKLR